MAKNEWLWIAESDDYADTTFLEKCIAKMDGNEDVGIVYAQSHLVDEEDNIIGNHLKHLSVIDPELWKNDFCLPGPEVLSKYMIAFSIIPNVSGVLFKKSLVQHIDWSEIQSFKLSGDRLFWSKLLLETNLCFVAESLNYFRMGSNTVRNKVKYTPGYLFEILRVLLFITGNVKVARKDRKKAINNLKTHYKNITKDYSSRLGMKEYINLLRKLYNFDPKWFIFDFAYIVNR
jgi:hypothetical protein